MKPPVTSDCSLAPKLLFVDWLKILANEKQAVQFRSPIVLVCEQRRCSHMPGGGPRPRQTGKVVCQMENKTKSRENKSHNILQIPICNKGRTCFIFIRRPPFVLSSNKILRYHI